MSRVQKLNVWIKGQHFVRNTNCQGAGLGVRMMKSGNDAENKNMFRLPSTGKDLRFYCTWLK